MKPRHVAILAHYGEDYLHYRYKFLAYLKSLGYSGFGIVPKDTYESEITRLPDSTYFYRYERNWKFVFYLLSSYYRIHKILKEEQPSHIFTYKFFPNIVGALAARKALVPNICCTIAGIGFLARRRHSLLITFIFRIYCIILNKADYLVFQNQNDLEDFQPYLSKPQCILTNGSGVDKARFTNAINTREHFSKTHGLFPNRRYLTFCTRIVREKGILELLEAFLALEKANNINFHLIIAGWYDEKDLEEQAEKLISQSSKIHYLGYQENVKALIHFSEAVVLPSYYPEGVPRSLTESLAMGKPIITTDSRGCKETCKNGTNGWIVQPKSVEDLCLALKSFNEITDERLREYSNNSKKLFEEKFDQKVVFKQIQKALSL